MSHQCTGTSSHLQMHTRSSRMRSGEQRFTYSPTIQLQGEAHFNQLCQEAITFWHFCIKKDIMPTAAQLKSVGSQNQLANYLSRIFSDNHEWSLKSGVVRSIFREQGIPFIKLLGPKDNKKCQFCSRVGLGPGTISNVFSLNWRVDLMYTFSPCPLIHQISSKSR